MMTSLRGIFLLTLLGVATSCAMPPNDAGVVLSCFGSIDETIPGDGVADSTIVTNLYFGGCSPDDPGMQVLMRTDTVTAAEGDPATLIAACNQGCQDRLNLYHQSHQELSAPAPALTCDTTFVAACGQLAADLSNMTTPVGVWGGGPADNRVQLTGTATVTIDQRSATVPVHGIADLTLAQNCNANNQRLCPVVVPRFDVVADDAFTVNGITVDTAHIQNDQIIRGIRNGQQFVFDTNVFKLEVNYTIHTAQNSFHVANNVPVTDGQNGDDITSFFPVFDGTFAPPGQNNQTLHLHLTSTPIGQRPVADLTPRNSQNECTCSECTPVTISSTSTDPDQDLESLTWTADGKMISTDQLADPNELPMQLALGEHNVTLMVQDSRGAASLTSTKVTVVDTTPPVVTAPPPATMKSCGFPDIGMATATDACSEVVLSSDDPGIFKPGHTDVTFVGEDSSLNDGRDTTSMDQERILPEHWDQCCPPGTTVRWVVRGVPFWGTTDDECIIGTSGNDEIHGMGGNDYVIGGPGNDTIITLDGNDTIVGNEGDDVIDAGDGNNRVAGGSGNDTITTGKGDDFILGGTGNDIINAGDGNNHIVGGPGMDHLTGGKDSDYIDGGLDEDWIFGLDGDDILIGGLGPSRDHIQGGPGNDFVAGLDGDDELDAGPENGPSKNLVIGGRGNDTCVGGPNDTLKTCE